MRGREGESEGGREGEGREREGGREGERKGESYYCILPLSLTHEAKWLTVVLHQTYQSLKLSEFKVQI